MSLNPWVALILGILIGWLLEWLLELWFFRRRRLDGQQRLTKLEADLQMRDAELRNARMQSGLLETDLKALRAQAPTEAGAEAELPAIDFDRLSARVEAPEVEVELPAVEVEAPTVVADLPEVESSKLELPKIDLPDVDFDALKGKVAGGVAAAGGLVAGLVGKLGGEADVPDRHAEELPQVEAELPAIDFDRLSARVEAPEVEVELPAVEVEAPTVVADLPEVELPDIAVEAPTAAVEWPELSARVGEVETELPAVGAPHIAADLPGGGVKLPEAALEALVPGVAPLPQADDLTLISGIGPKFAAQLSAAGITSYAALSAARPEQLNAIVGAPAWRRVDYGSWITGAQKLLDQPPAGRVGDDLTLLEGIGPVYATKLNAAGIRTFADLAAADEAGLSGIIQAPAWRRVDYDAWIAQAQLAAAGDQAGLQALQAKLFSREGDNIGLVSGVGEKAAQALSAAGITSFSTLAAATPDQLAQITRAAGVRGGDFGAWIEEAKLRAAGKRITRAPHARGGKAVSCPQDLSRVKGIGSIYEQKLYAAGIGTFWTLAQIEDGELARILELKDFQDVNLSALKADALRLAEETGTTGRRWDGTPPDDFEPFEGIGEVYEGRLYDAGFCTYRALANATVEQLAEICHAPEWRKPDYASWIAQAQRMLSREG